METSEVEKPMITLADRLVLESTATLKMAVLSLSVTFRAVSINPIFATNGKQI